MTTILVTGRNLTRATVERALYGDWAIDWGYSNEAGSFVGVLKQIGNGSPDYQIGRLQSFGTIGVRLNPTTADVAAALERLG